MDMTFLAIGLPLGMGSGIACGIAIGMSGRVKKEKIRDLIRQKGIQISDRSGKKISTDRFFRMISSDGDLWD